MMSRKHYRALAQAIRDARPYASPIGRPEIQAANDVVDNVARNLADECKRDNPRFDRVKFFAACGVSE